MSWGSLWSQLFGHGDMEVNAVESFENSALNTPSNAQVLTTLNQQNQTPQDALSMLKDMAETDPAYKELYLQLLAERENTKQAQEWYENFNANYYQRMYKDLESAGVNPWLALQALGSAGTGSIQAAGSWSGSSGSTVSAKQKEQQNDLKKQALGSFGSILAAIAGALIIALL